MGALTVACSVCNKTWKYLNPDDVATALNGLAAVENNMENAQKKINNANDNCGEKEFNFGGVTMLDTFSDIIKSGNASMNEIKGLSGTIMADANSQSSRQKAAADAAAKACEEEHAKAAAAAAAAQKKNSD